MGFGPLGEKRKFTLVQQFTVIKLKKHKAGLTYNSFGPLHIILTLTQQPGES